MATKSNKDKNPLIDSLINLTNYNKKTIQEWVKANASATYGFYNQFPLRQPLIDVLAKVTMDPHLSALMQQRGSRVTGETFEIVRNKTVDENLTSQINDAAWLQQFFQGCMNARWYGYTLFETYEFSDNGELTELREVNRRNVIPERRVVVLLPKNWTV